MVRSFDLGRSSPNLEEKLRSARKPSADPELLKKVGLVRLCTGAVVVRSDRVDQLGLTVTVGAGGGELGAGCGLAVGVDEGSVVADGVVAGVLAAVVGEVLALGVGNGFTGRGCLVCGC
jgi:hypothetical protein